MPFHRWFVPPTLYTKEEKAAIAKAIADLYHNIPAFYVVTVFIKVDQEDFFVGENAKDDFVRISVEHMARHHEGFVLAHFLRGNDR